jgi:hypothetical protein
VANVLDEVDDRRRHGHPFEAFPVKAGDEDDVGVKRLSRWKDELRRSSPRVGFVPAGALGEPDPHFPAGGGGVTAVVPYLQMPALEPLKVPEEKKSPSVTTSRWHGAHGT